MKAQSGRVSPILLLLAALALIAYSLPWLMGVSTGLSFGAYDLAEWSSLNPAVRAQSPSLLTSLLLRLPLACLALMIAFSAPLPARGRGQWLAAALWVIALGLLQLPPASFFLSAQDDPNYRQQFLLAIFTLTFGGIGLSGIVPHIRIYAGLAAAVTAGISSVIGLNQAYGLMRDFSLSASVAPGSIFFVALLLIIAGMMWSIKK